MAKSEDEVDSGRLTIDTLAEEAPTHDEHGIRPGVGWVSTERHMKSSKSRKTTNQILFSDGSTPTHVGLDVARWMGIDENVLERPFYKLSQGQQKAVLLASAIASRPSVLVLDEPCQGLDLLARRRLLGLVERICQATNLSLVYITHHLDELIPSVTHVIHLADGQDVYQGSRKDYDPASVPSASGEATKDEEFME